MNFQSKAQSINDYLDKLYVKLVKDSKLMSDWETLSKSCSLEPRKLAVYASAIKEELKTEMHVRPAFQSMSESEKQRLLATIDNIHARLVIPEFQPVREACTEEVPVEVVTRTAPSHGQSSSYLNLGTPAGAIIGIGLGLIISKTIPALLIGGIGGAVAGTLIASKARATRSKQPMGSSQAHRRHTSATVRTRAKLNHRKVEEVILKRKTVITPVFLRYLKQLEEACQTAGQL